MSLTVRELIAIPTLQTRVLAGAAGIDRQVNWAHSCEMSEPWQWMGSGDLLMTVGHGFPASAAEQVAYVERLAEANFSGLALAVGMFAPPLTEEARSAADRLAFPILESAYQIPFVMVARAVADSNQREGQARLARVLRMYDTYRQATADVASDAQVIARLGGDVGATLHLLDIADGAATVSSDGAPADDAIAEVLAQLRSRGGPLPAVVRISAAGKHFVVLPLDSGERWALATAVSESAIDLVVLQHAATIAHIQLERRRTADLLRLHVGGRLLHQIMSGRMDSELAAQHLREYGIQGPPWSVVLVDDGGQSDVLSIQGRLLSNAVPHLINRTDEGLLMVIEAGQLESLRGLALPRDARIGVSDPINVLSRLSDAAREARWALEAASAGVPIARHGFDHSMFLPRTVHEGEIVVARVLGPISDYDAAHGGNLIHSLQVFFAAQRSWQAAATKLGIHKQTLIYRMRRVEEITGRKLDQLDDIAEVHLALRTRELLARGTPAPR